MKCLFFLLLFNIACFGQHHYLVLNFNEPMDTSSLREISNYTVFDIYGNEVQIAGVGLIQNPDSTLADTSVCLVVPHLDYKTDFVVRVLEKPIPVNAIASKESEPGNVALNVFDGDTTTVWTAEPIPQFVTLEMDRVSKIQQVSIAFNLWYTGRIYTFNVESSVNGIDWVTLADSVESNTGGGDVGVNWDIGAYEVLAFSGDAWTHVFPNEHLFAKYVRITVIGNTQSNWANIMEINIRGSCVTDLAGNAINTEKDNAWVYFDGYNPDEPKPIPFWKQ